jgi:NADPH:quinone reductase-like Zn-dependent oxidoreductase
MKAVCFSNYGTPEVLELRTVEKPTPKEDEVLIRIHAATVTPGDCEIRSFKFPFWVWIPLRLYMGILKPKRPIIGMEFSGVVESVGDAVTQFKPGDPVFAGTGIRFGTYAEYRCQRADTAMAVKPVGLSHAEAATIGVGGLNALHYLRQGKIQPGDKVLINGAAGCFGTYAVQLAKHFGAEVTGVDSTDKLDTMRELGADHVIDFTQEDFTNNGVRYDVILEIAGKASYSRCIRSLNRNGRLVLANPKFRQMLRAPLTSRFTDKTVSLAFAEDRTEDLEYVAKLMEEGTLKAVIDRSYPLDEVADAHRYVETGAKIGQVVINVEP